MLRLLNLIEKLLTMVLSVTYFFSVANFQSIFMIIFITIISIFTFGTCIADIIKLKPRNIKYTLLNILLILILLLNIYRPFIDNLLIKNLDYGEDTFLMLRYSIDLLNQNSLLVTIFMIILFIINFKIKDE